MKYVWVVALGLIVCMQNSTQARSQRARRHFVQSAQLSALHDIDQLGKRRNLVIIQDDVNEIEGMLGACTLSLLRALQAESAPILVSSSIWINMSLYLHAHGNEHRLKPRRKEWIVYRISSEVYCAVPKKYEERILAITDQMQMPEMVRDCFTGNLLTKNDIAMGLKCSQFKKIDSPFSISWTKLIGYRLQIMGNAFSLYAQFSPQLLRKVLLNADDVANIDTYPAYDIFMVGHGRGSSLLGCSIIAGFSIAEFRRLLSFLDKKIHTHLFMYQTCFGGGAHLTVPYMTNGNPDLYNFAIVSCCTGAMPAAVYFDPESKHSLDFTAIFKDVADNSLSEDSIQMRLANFYPSKDEAPKKRVLHNIPSIRLPRASEFVALADSSNTTIQVYKPATALGDQVVINDKQAFLFYDQGITHTPVILKGKCPALIPMDPVTNKVVIKSLDACEHTFHDVLLHCFAPISMLEAPAGTVLIKELCCKLHDADQKASILHNVTVKSVRETPVLETFYERQLDVKYYYNFALRKRVTYEHNGNTYKFTVKPKHRPDYLGKILLVSQMIFASVYGVNPQVAQLSIFAQDLDPKRLWVFSEERKMRKSNASRYEREFIACFDQVATPVSERYQLALANLQAKQQDGSIQLAKA